MLWPAFALVCHSQGLQSEKKNHVNRKLSGVKPCGRGKQKTGLFFLCVMTWIPSVTSLMTSWCEVMPIPLEYFGKEIIASVPYMWHPEMDGQVGSTGKMLIWEPGTKQETEALLTVMSSCWRSVPALDSKLICFLVSEEDMVNFRDNFITGHFKPTSPGFW